MHMLRWEYFPGHRIIIVRVSVGFFEHNIIILFGNHCFFRNQNYVEISNMKSGSKSWAKKKNRPTEPVYVNKKTRKKDQQWKDKMPFFGELGIQRNLLQIWFFK